MKRLGMNTVHLNMEEIVALGLNRVEFVLGRGKEYELMLDDVINGIYEAEVMNLPYSIHLPLYLFDWYQEDYLSAFYLDPKEEKRNLSFKFLESNIERLKRFQPEYYIIHFPGVYKFVQDKEEFKERLNSTLKRLDDMAKKFGIKLLLEYFGSNFMFYRIDEWIENIGKYDNLGILCDTGHLYFSSIMHEFDFYQGLIKISQHAEAFHLWTTMGKNAYSENSSYQKYHHIVMHTDQDEVDGFAFDVKKTMAIIMQYNRPMIIEASQNYRGRSYFIEGIQSIVKLFY